MKTTIKLIAFFVYTIGLFCINDFYLLAFLGIVQILIMFVCRISIKEVTKTIMQLMPFILFTVIIDLFLMELVEAIQIGIRLILVCHMTYLFGKTTTTMQIAKAVKQLLYPLKRLGVNIDNIGIMVSLANTLIPNIKQEMEQIRYSLKAKGFDMHFKNQVKHINYIMAPLFYSLLRKVSKLEEALESKGYVEE